MKFNLKALVEVPSKEYFSHVILSFLLFLSHTLVLVHNYLFTLLPLSFSLSLLLFFCLQLRGECLGLPVAVCVLRDT